MAICSNLCSGGGSGQSNRVRGKANGQKQLIGGEASFSHFHVRTFGIDDQVFHQSANTCVPFIIRALQCIQADTALRLLIKMACCSKHLHGILNKHRLCNDD